MKKSILILSSTLLAAATTVPAWATTHNGITWTDSDNVRTFTGNATGYVLINGTENNNGLKDSTGITKLVFNSVGGTGDGAWFKNNATVTQAIELQGTGLRIKGGTTNGDAVFSGTITGLAETAFTWASDNAGNQQDYVFTGDLSGFAGNFVRDYAAFSTGQTNLGAGNSEGILQFGAATAALAPVATNISGTGSISTTGVLRYNYSGVPADSDASALMIGNTSITARYLEFKGGANYTVSSGTTVSGTGLGSTLRVNAGTTEILGTLSNFETIQIAEGATLQFTSDTKIVYSAGMFDNYSLFRVEATTDGGNVGTLSGWENVLAENISITGTRCSVITLEKGAEVGVVNITNISDVINSAANLTWNADSGNWNTIAKNWTKGVTPNVELDYFYQYDNVTFARAGTPNITLVENIHAGTVTVSENTSFAVNTYSLVINSLVVDGGKTATFSVNATNAANINLASATLNAGSKIEQMISAVGTEALTIGSLTLNGDASLYSTSGKHGTLWKINELIGEGHTLTLDDQHQSNAQSRYEFAGDGTSGQFTGTVYLNQNQAGAARHTAIQISNDTILEKAVLQFSSDGIKPNNNTHPTRISLAINTDHAKVAGLDSTTGGSNFNEPEKRVLEVFSGTIDSGSGDDGTQRQVGSETANILEIATAEGKSYTFAGNFKNVNIEKSGAGTQMLSGVIADGSTTAHVTIPVSVSVSAGTLKLSGTNTFTGGTTISGGILEAGSASALGSGAVTISGGQLKIGDGVTLNNTALKIVVGDGDYTSDGNCAIVGGTGAAFVSETTITIEKAAVEVAAVYAMSLENPVYYISSGLDLTGVTISLGTGFEGYSYNIDGNVLTLTIPEPSAFGLLAGLGALALAGTRRRRKVK